MSELEVGQTVYGARIWARTLRQEQATITKITAKMIYLDRNVGYSSQYRKNDNGVSLTEREALEKLEGELTRQLIRSENTVAAYRKDRDIVRKSLSSLM